MNRGRGAPWWLAPWRVLEWSVCGWAVWALCALLLAAPPALGDEIRPFAIEVREEAPDIWRLTWKQPTSAPGARALAVPHIPDNCSFAGEPTSRDAPLALIGSARMTCKGPLDGGTFALPQLSGNADALLRLIALDGTVQAHRLTASAPSVTIASQPSRGFVARTYFIIGAEHILLGWDHLLFVIALVLLVAGGWQVVKAVTAFTIAHSITLIASILGYAGLPPKPVEALIALSIVFLALELARGRENTWTKRYPWAVAFAFGLFHGFGFAGALSEIGLPQGELPMALFAFNLGVEAGQLLIVAAIITLSSMIARLAPQREHLARTLATYTIGIIASYWLIDRLIG